MVYCMVSKTEILSELRMLSLGKQIDVWCNDKAMDLIKTILQCCFDILVNNEGMKLWKCIIGHWLPTYSFYYLQLPRDTKILVYSRYCWHINMLRWWSNLHTISSQMGTWRNDVIMPSKRVHWCNYNTLKNRVEKDMTILKILGKNMHAKGWKLQKVSLLLFQSAALLDRLKGCLARSALLLLLSHQIDILKALNNTLKEMTDGKYFMRFLKAYSHLPTGLASKPHWPQGKVNLPALSFA